MSSRGASTDWFKVIVIVDLLILNIAVWNLWKNKKDKENVLAATAVCPSACVNLINSGKSASSEQVIKISATGSTRLTSWTTIPGSEFSFNKANYKNAKKIYFQANLSTDAGDRTAYARLYDQTHGIGITGSEMTTLNTSLKQIQSGEINPFSGDLTIGVQVKSLNGNLVSLSNPRLVVVY